VDTFEPFPTWDFFPKEKTNLDMPCKQFPKCVIVSKPNESSSRIEKKMRGNNMIKKKEKGLIAKNKNAKKFLPLSY